MHIHILGISGTFMSALALLAREKGYKVTGSDLNCYPPVSDLLKAKGIAWVEGYEDTQLALACDKVIVGNAIKRGMPVLEAIMAQGIPYTSGPQWLADTILPDYKVIAVAGTHGKTTTTSMLAWILHEAGLEPGFLIGGVATDFKTSASLGKGDWFVIEADEYDSAFFDKRPKFMHYRPEIAILNNLEFDHADIYPDLAAIQQQFHYLMRTIPSIGLVLKPRDDKALNTVVEKGQYCRVETMALSGDSDWRAEILDESGSAFNVYYRNALLMKVQWSLIGAFNVENAMAALAASTHVGVNPERAAKALSRFSPVKRRLEVKYAQNGLTIYDDFAHHPTAIAKTISALRSSERHKRILVIMEFASFTMRTGVHAKEFSQALAEVDIAYVLEPADFSLQKTAKQWHFPYKIIKSTDGIIAAILPELREGDAVLIMSNRGFEGIHQRLIQALEPVTL